MKFDLNQKISEIKYYGYTKLDGFFNEGIIESLTELVNLEYDKFLKSKNIYPDLPQRDVNDKRLYNLHNIDKKFIDLISNDELDKILKYFLNDKFYRLLPENSSNYILNYFNARSSGNYLDLHIDSHIPYIGENLIMMQMVILLEDSTYENGCTIVVPGSHNSGQFCDRDFKNAVKLEGKKGDVIFWDSRLWHGALENKTLKSRWAIIATFSQWWIKQSMDIQGNLKDEIYKKLSDNQKVLLGFCSIPSKDPYIRVNPKGGYEFLKKSVKDY